MDLLGRSVCTLPNNRATLPQKGGCGRVSHPRVKGQAQHGAAIWLLVSWSLTQHFLSQFCVSAQWALAQRLEPCSKERRDIACEKLRLFGGSARHRCPLTDVVEALRPLTRRGAIGDELVIENGDCGWHCDEIIGAKRDSIPAVIEVVSDRGSDGLRRPVDHDGGEQFLLPESTLNVAMAVTPGAELLHDPGGQTYQRVVQPIG